MREDHPRAIMTDTTETVAMVMVAVVEEKMAEDVIP
jgi:hypothetical protein